MTSTISGAADAVRAGAIAVKYGRFSVFVAGQVTITGSFGAAGTDARMFLYDNNGNLLATSDDAGGTQPLSAIVANLPVGTYFVAISSDPFDASEGLSGVNLDDEPAPVPFSITVTDGSGEGFTTPLQGARSDNLTDTPGNDRLYGLEGQDTLAVSNGIDEAHGGLGPDQLILNYSGSTASIVTIGGAPQVDPNGGLAGGFTDNAGRQVTFDGIETFSINAGSGNDTITTGGGLDILNGGAGDDILDGGAGDDIVNGEAGNDTLIAAGTGSDSVDGGADVDTLKVDYSDAATAITGTLNGTGPYSGSIGDGAARQVSYNGIERFDVTTGSGNDTIRTGSGDDVVHLGGGDDLFVGGGGNDLADGGTGIDGLNVDIGTTSADVVWNLQTGATSGTGGTYTGFEYFQSLNTGSGNDTIVTTDDQRSDSLFLQGGNDSATVRNGTDSVNGGAGTDTLIIDYSSATASITTTGGEPTDQFGNGYLGSYGDGAQRSVGFQGIDLFNITTGSGNDTIILPNGANRITNDIVSLGAGNDAVNLGQGMDVADGGDGIDGLGANQSAATVDIRLDLIAGTYSGAAGTSFTRFEYLGAAGAINGFQSGSGNDTIVTASLNLNDQVATNAGNDRVTFYDGSDQVNFGAGIDTLVLDYSAATAGVHNGQQPTDFSNTGTYFGDFTDGATRTATYSEAERFDIATGSGNDLINTGNNDDTLHLGAGNDVASTGGGNDLLDGGTGADTLTGGAGNDVYVIDDAGDIAIENAGGGIDEIRTTLAVYSIAGQPELENLTGLSATAQDLRGNGASNVVTGGAGNDFIRLQDGGSDTAIGNGGGDAFYFGAGMDAADKVDGGDGADIVALQGDYGSSSGLGGSVTPFVLGAEALVNVETLSLLTSADARFGGDSGNPFSYYVATVDANVAAGAQLIVNASTLGSAETLYFDGSAETDGGFFIYAGAGSDTLIGGGGNDVFFFAEGRAGPSDTVDGNGGADIIVLRGNYAITLGENFMHDVETVTLMSAQDTRFYAGGTRYGYDVTTSDGNVAAGATVTFNGGRLTAEEGLTFNGSAEHDGSFRVFGGAAADHIVGGDGADLLYGGLGGDYLNGGAGADTYSYKSAAESTSTGFDTIDGFAFGVDVLDLPGTHDSFQLLDGGRLDVGSFDADLSTAMDGVLDPSEAVIFTASSGFFAGETFAVIDQNGIAGYQAGEDFVIHLTNAIPAQTGVPDFIV